MLLTDYLLHWVDITRCWLAEGGAGAVAPGARRRLAGAGPARERAQPLVGDASMATGSGRHGDAAHPRQQRRLATGVPVLGPRHQGTLRGSVLLDSDRLSSTAERPADRR